MPPLGELARAVQAACPDQAIGDVRELDTGFGSTVLQTSTGLILRVGRTPASARGHAVEAATLPALAPLLPVAVPVPCLFSPPSRSLPFGVIGHARLPGQPCTPDTATAVTSHDLGEFMAVLHEVPTSSFPAMPGKQATWQSWRDLRAGSEAVLADLLTAAENDKLSRWWDAFLTDRRMREYQPAVRHGDLWYGNLLIRADGSITAVLDWEAVAVADPAQDLAVSRYLGPAFVAAVLGEYRRHGGVYDERVRYRMDRHWELRELTGIPLAAVVGDRQEIAECVAKLRAGPIFSR